MAGDGVRNPSDLTPVIDGLGDIGDELDDIDDQLDDIEAALVIIDNEIEVIDGVVDAVLVHTTLIEAVTSALPTLAETGGTITTDGTEQSVYINAVPLGVFNPICVKINCTAHTAGETIVIREYYDIAPGGAGLLLADTLIFAGAILPPILTIDLDPNRYGVRVTIEKTAGANRAYPWEVFYEI